MTKHDRIIRDLLNALDVIQREAEKPEGSKHYIIGAAAQAVQNCTSQMERNRDGYLVVKKDKSAQKVRELCTLCDGTGDSGDWRALNCERCGGSGKELR